MSTKKNVKYDDTKTDKKKTGNVTIYIDDKIRQKLKKIREVEIFNLSFQARNIIEKRYSQLRKEGIIE